MSVPSYADRQAQLAPLRAALRSADRPADKLAAATSLLNVIGQLAVLAPTAQLRAAWIGQYRDLQPQAAALRSNEQYLGRPEWIRTLDAFVSRVLGLADTVAGGAAGVVEGAGGLAKALPLIAIVILIVIGIGLYKGSLRARVGK